MMLSLRLNAFLLVLLLTLVSGARAATALIPAPPQLAASSYVLMDALTGDILVAENEEEPLPPASLTKLMTSYVIDYELAQGTVSTEDLVPVSEKAWRTKGSRMFIREGTQVRLLDLMRGIIIQSGNDASVAAAEYIAGSEGAFADLMNQHASRLGMEDSHFVNATGLPSEDHYASARDLALLARAIIRDYPQHYPLYAEKYFTYNEIRQPNRNKLLWRDDSVDGLKTGHTEAAGYCLVASAQRDDMRLISVVMGARSVEARAQESQKLLSYGFRYYDSRELYPAGEVLNRARIWAGQADEVSLGVAEPLALTLPRGKEDALEVTLDLDKVIRAPVQRGDVKGEVRVSLDGETLATQPVVALEPVAEAGFIKRLWHAIVLFFMGLIG